MSETNFAETIAELTMAGAKATQLTTPDKRQFLVRPQGVELKEVTDPHGLIPADPIRIATTVTVQTVDSLVDYSQRFLTATSLILADIEKNRIRTALDYHGPGKPQHLQHTAILDLPYSLEWKTWTAASGKMLTQLDFARFIEENAPDIEAPAGADLLEIVRDLQALRRVDFRKVVRTATDCESIEYSDTTDARTKNGAVEVPTKFMLKIPVYFGGDAVTVFAHLRWALDDTTLRLGVSLNRAEAVRQAVFRDIVQDVAHRTELLAVYGRVNGAE